MKLLYVFRFISTAYTTAVWYLVYGISKSYAYYVNDENRIGRFEQRALSIQLLGETTSSKH